MANDPAAPENMPFPPRPSALLLLPLSARLVIATYLISVGIGYFSALVQLHFQQAPAGELLPGPDDVKAVYSGARAMGQFERLIRADEHKPFNGSGTMRSAFTTKSSGWKRKVRELAEEHKTTEAKAEALLRQERDFEINALLAWIKAGAKEDDYASLALPDGFLKSLPPNAELPSDFFEKKDDQWHAKIGAIIDTRCARCHAPGKGGSAGHIHLDTYRNVMDFIPPTGDTDLAGGMSLQKLAQSTHVHLLGFSMLYGLTGLAFAFTSYPLPVRCILGPLALVAQVAEISCWWLSRADPVFTLGIMGLGAVVAMSLGLQIVLTLYDLFSNRGRVVLALLLVVLMGVALVVKVQVIGPHLNAGKAVSGRLHSAE